MKTLAQADRMLEDKFSRRNLHIHRSGGTCPLQSFGEIDGYLLYFRFRSNNASLKVGIIDQNYRDMIDAQNKAKYDELLQNNNDDSMWTTILSVARISDMWSDDYPDRILFESKLEEIFNIGNQIENIYADLTPTKYFEVFSELIQNLEQVPVELQIPTINY